jgi:SAM-dependent methyltransferase
MDDYTASTYGDRIADIYDTKYASLPFGGDLNQAIALLADLAGEGPALELGIGTGRIALPLLEAGVDVRGVDASAAMAARLAAKPGGERIPVTIADFRDFTLPDRFALVFVVFNTFFGLLTQQHQIDCLETVTRHLADGGAFVLEAFVPDVSRFDHGQRLGVVRSEVDEVELEASRYDPVEQRVDTNHVIIRPDGISLYPVKLRFATVAELDLMARLAGLRLRERWADWDRSPFRAESPKHISVWERA